MKRASFFQSLVWISVFAACAVFVSAQDEIRPAGMPAGMADATYITQTASTPLTAEQALDALASGIMRVDTAAGVITSLTNSAGIAANLSDETGTGLVVFSTNPVFTTQVTAPGGAEATPGIVFSTDTDTGIYAIAGGFLRFTSNGIGYWSLQSGGDLLPLVDGGNSFGGSANRINSLYMFGLVSHRRLAVTVDVVTTFAATSDYALLACTGPETINTITGGIVGTRLVIEHTDTDCTIADDDDPTAADAIDLTGVATSDVGAVAKFITLIYNGTSWFQVAESDN